MEFLSVDLGSYKTVIASSKENGKIIGDEQDKRNIKTVLECTKPIRKFGNNITSECEQSVKVRHRNFFKDDAVMFMFLKYLQRLIKSKVQTNPGISFIIPEYAKEIDRRRFLDLCQLAELKVSAFYTDVTAVGVFASLRRENTPSTFVVLDCGYSKTTAGAFTFENKKFTPTYRKCIKIGARDFDARIIQILTQKHKLPDTLLVKEKILRVLDKMKTSLNSTSKASAQIWLTEDPTTLVITQEEFRESVSGELRLLENFINEVKEDTKLAQFELAGGNSNSFLIKDLLKDGEYNLSLDTSESAAVGSALALACSFLSTPFSIHEVTGRDFAVKLKSTDVKPTLIFPKESLINGDIKEIIYKRKSSFELEVFEDGEKVAELSVRKESSSEALPVKINAVITRFGTFEIVDVVCDGLLGYEYTPYGLSKEQKQQIVMEENAFRNEERALEQIGHMRNDLEMFVSGLYDTLRNAFDDEFKASDGEKIGDIEAIVYDLPMSTTIDEEQAHRDDVMRNMNWVGDRLALLKQQKNEEVANIKKLISEFKVNNSGVFTPSFYKLQGLLYKAEEFLNRTNFSLTSINWSHCEFEAFCNEVNAMIERAKNEVEDHKKKEEARKAANTAGTKKKTTAEDRNVETKENNEENQRDEDPEDNVSDDVPSSNGADKEEGKDL